MAFNDVKCYILVRKGENLLMLICMLVWALDWRTKHAHRCKQMKNSIFWLLLHAGSSGRKVSEHLSWRFRTSVQRYEVLDRTSACNLFTHVLLTYSFKASEKHGFAWKEYFRSVVFCSYMATFGPVDSKWMPLFRTDALS